jgi:iron complex outermembrane receptor protein
MTRELSVLCAFRAPLNGATLIFSYVGYAKVERAATEGTINVVLAEEGGQALSEIVIWF